MFEKIDRRELAVFIVATTVLGGFLVLYSGGNVEKLTVEKFQKSSVTGTMEIPSYVNDNDPNTSGWMDKKGEFAVINLGDFYYVDEFKRYGDRSNKNGGVWRIEYWNGSSWKVWKDNIPGIGTKWGNWESLEPKEVSKIKIVCTETGSAVGWERSWPREWKFRGTEEISYNNYNLNASVTPTGAGKVFAEPEQGTYKENKTVDVTVEPGHYYKFKKWKGEPTMPSVFNPLNPSMSIKMDHDTTLTAVLENKKPPTPATKSASTTKTSATLKSDFDLGEFDNGKISFKYRKKGGGWKATDWVTKQTGGTYEKTLNNLEKGTTYEYFPRIEYSPRIETGDTLTLTTDSDTNESPTPDFSYSPTTPGMNETVNFDASKSSDPDGEITSYSWDFGNGDMGSGETVNNTYSSSDNYTVTLTTKDDDGAVSSTSKEVSVSKAIYEPSMYSLTVVKKPEEGGSITLTPSREKYMEGTEVTLSVTPSEGWGLDHFGKELSGTGELSKTITMNEDKKVTINFYEKEDVMKKIKDYLPFIFMGIGGVIMALAGVLKLRKS